MTISCNNKAPFAKKPRAVLFDADNTLYAYEPAHDQAMRATVEKAKRALAVDAATFRDAFEKARKAIKERLAGTVACHSRLLYMQGALEQMGLKTQLYMALDLEQTYWRTFMASAVLFPHAREFIDSVRRAGLATCVVTDLAAQIQFRKLIYFNLNDCFDYVVTSEEAGAEKPAAAPFELAFAKLGVKARECVMIGDDARTDLAGAKALGIPTIQKRHTGVKVPGGDNKPDLVFDHYTELEQYFGVCGWLDAVKKKTA
jgi:putative hydrolase of the HAD superfamily